nr:reverse transcriptase domain-containing protein [Tanacetum cinerariifolium]
MVQSWQRKTRQKVSQKFSRGSEISFPTLTADNTVVEPLTIEIYAGGHDIHRMYIDGGASADILYEHCFQRLRPEVKSQLNPATTSLTGFTREKIWPIGKIRLLVIVGNEEHSMTTWMTFTVIRSPSPYNGIIGRPGISAIRTVPSTAHGMLKFPLDGGIVTIYNTTVPPKECNIVACDPTQTQTQHAAKRNLDIFAWEPKRMTGVPYSITEHKLKIQQGYSPVRQKKRGQAPKRAKAILEEAHKLVDAGLILTNPKEMEFTYVLRFEFAATNNEAEYEALIAGLRIATRMGTCNLEANVDSRLVVNHVLGEYADYVLREIHAGSCSMHSGPWSVVARALRSGYYWPTMYRDARDVIKKCSDCQVHRPIPRQPQQQLTPITSPWPFYKWGIDIAGPFPVAAGGLKFLIVAIDYFTKWIEAKAMVTITDQVTLCIALMAQATQKMQENLDQSGKDPMRSLKH